MKKFKITIINFNRYHVDDVDITDIAIYDWPELRGSQVNNGVAVRYFDKEGLPVNTSRHSFEMNTPEDITRLIGINADVRNI
jgi:uncharacterized protein YkuJ